MRYFLFAIFFTLLIFSESFSAGWKDNVGKTLVGPYVSVAIPSNPKEFRLYNISPGYGVVWERITKKSIIFRPAIWFTSFEQTLEVYGKEYNVNFIDIVYLDLSLIYKPLRDNNIAPYCGFGIDFIRKETDIIFEGTEISYSPGISFLFGVDFIIQNTAVIFVEQSYKSIFDGDNTGYFNVNFGLGLMF